MKKLNIEEVGVKKEEAKCNFCDEVKVCFRGEFCETWSREAKKIGHIFDYDTTRFVVPFFGPAYHKVISYESGWVEDESRPETEYEFYSHICKDCVKQLK